jgi:hypothetical protein
MTTTPVFIFVIWFLCFHSKGDAALFYATVSSPAFKFFWFQVWNRVQMCATPTCPRTNPPLASDRPSMPDG